MDERIIRAKIDAVGARAIVARVPIGGWRARSADHAGPAAYRFHGGWAPVPDESFWEAGRTLFLRTEAALPPAPANATLQAAPGVGLYATFDILHLEGLLSIDGAPWAGIDARHPRAALPVRPPALPLALELEFSCVPAATHEPALRRERARFRDARFELVDREAEALWYDLRFAAEAARAVKDARRRRLLEAGLEDALLAVDLQAPAADWPGVVRAARALLADRLDAIAPDPEGGSVALTGHSHIDTAWLWTLRETVRKCGRTFSTACRMMERFPSFRFSCSQPQLYAYAKRHFPAVYAQVKRWVNEGRWEATGGMWVESDCNVPSGEALVRQFLHGIAFFQAEFGRRPRSCWLPDVFGYPASLPGILVGCGIDFFFTTKLHWQARNPFPAHLFHWEGIDGSRVLGHVPRLPDMYNGIPDPAQLAAAWDGYLEKAAHPELLFPFGCGDGGGGPTEWMLEYAERARAFPGLPRTRQVTAEEWFETVRAAAPALPTWAGELYLETHRGTCTTQAAIKRANRKNELALREAEIFASAAAIAAGARYPAGELGAAWENLLLLQFHDILPGSSIGEVYREALADHARIGAAARAVRDAAAAALAHDAPAPALPASAGPGALLVFNSLPWERRDPVEATIPDPGTDDLAVAWSAEDAVPAQVIGRSADGVRIVFAGAPVPPAGWTCLSVGRAEDTAAPAMRVDGRTIETDLFVVEIGADGTLARLLDKRHAREVVPAGRGANDLQLFQDGPEREAAWNVHATFERRRYAWESVEVSVVERGPVRAVVRVVRKYRSSVVEQDVVAWNGLDRIDFVTRADWQERQVLLKAAFPLEVRTARAAYEIQFGAVERPTHRNTPWDAEKFEVCAHRWADLSEAGYGASLLNDCRYGHDAHGDVLRLSLLRGSEWPDPDADRGRHEFTYALLPHGGDWREGGTVRRAWELNVPTFCVPATGAARAHVPADRSFLAVDGPAVLEAFKRAEDGDGWILRVSEPHGGRGSVGVRAPRPLSRVEACNHVEEGAQAVAHDGAAFRFPIRPFEVKSFRLRFA